MATENERRLYCVPPIERFPLGGQLGILRLDILYNSLDAYSRILDTPLQADGRAAVRAVTDVGSMS